MKFIYHQMEYWIFYLYNLPKCGCSHLYLSVADDLFWFHYHSRNYSYFKPLNPHNLADVACGPTGSLSIHQYGISVQLTSYGNSYMHS